MRLDGILRAAIISGAFCVAALGADAGLANFLVTNDDLPSPATNTATFFALNADGTLGTKATVATGGQGIAGGFFAAHRVVVAPNATSACVYVSNAGSGDIAGIDAATHTLTGNFFGSPTDSGNADGIGLVAGAKYVYATYSTSSTIGTFQVQPGCKLSFVGDLLAVGLNGGYVTGVAIHGNLMVVTYGDGSIESFNISGGAPVSNGDQQLSTGAANDDLPSGVVITHDGHFALFGDVSTRTIVEVSDISGGKLSPTIAYTLSPAFDSGDIHLTPSENLIYLSNEMGGKVTAAFFDATSGKVYPGCTSPTLKGFFTKFVYTGSVGLQLNTGTGGLIYVPEYGTLGRSFLGTLQFTPNSTGCTLTETANSPATGAPNSAFLSMAVYPVQP